MNIYTIQCTSTGVIVFDGKLKGARLKYEGNNLQIYVAGSFTIGQRDKVNYHAFSLARAHHIPLTELHAKGWI